MWSVHNTNWTHNLPVFNKVVITTLRYTPVVLEHHMPYKQLPNDKLFVCFTRYLERSLKNVPVSHRSKPRSSSKCSGSFTPTFKICSTLSSIHRTTILSCWPVRRRPRLYHTSPTAERQSKRISRFVVCHNYILSNADLFSRRACCTYGLRRRTMFVSRRSWRSVD
jgi:hypothetical protein